MNMQQSIWSYTSCHKNFIHAESLILLITAFRMVAVALPPHSTHRKLHGLKVGLLQTFSPLHCWCLSSIIVPLQLPQRFLNLSLWKQAGMLGTKRPPLLHPTPLCDHHPSANSVAATETADFGVSISITGAELTFEIRQKDWSLRGELKFGTCCPPSGSWHVSAEVPSNKAKGLGRLFTFSTSGNACR